MKNPWITPTIALMILCVGCETSKSHYARPAASIRAPAWEIPEGELLDVTIPVFKEGKVSEKTAKKVGTNQDIRKAESHFMAYHLKKTFEQSGHWGAVRVVPGKVREGELVVMGKIIESTGERLKLRITVVDATGREWYRKIYRSRADASSYISNVQGVKDAFQGVYNEITNDLSYFRRRLSAEDVGQIRETARLRFAADFSPEAFGNYVERSGSGVFHLRRLPAEDDPIMERIEKIRERDYMFVDTLNEYYGEFYNEIWSSYQNWRKFSQTELSMMRKMKRDATMQQLAGALMIAAAIAMDVGEVSNSGAMQGALAGVGGAVIVNGINISRSAQIHRDAIKELSDSLADETRPFVVEMEGQVYELSGTADDQYRQWRQLLQEIYAAETGFVADLSDIEITEVPLNLAETP